MDRKQARYVAVFAAVAAFCVAFAWPAVSPTALLWYYPLEHRWAYELRPSGLAMDWYGRMLLAAFASLGAFAAAHRVARRLGPLTPRGHVLWAVCGALAVLLAASLYVHQLVGRSPEPAPLPGWYVPK